MKNVCLYQTLMEYLFVFHLNMFLPFLKDHLHFSYAKYERTC